MPEMPWYLDRHTTAVLFHFSIVFIFFFFFQLFFRSPVQSLILLPLTYCANTFYEKYEITTASLCNTRNASTSPFYSRKLVMKMNYSNFNRVFGWEKLHYAAIGFGCEVARTQLHTVEMNNWHFSKAFSIIWFIDVPFSICRLQLQSFILFLWHAILFNS